MNTQFYFRLTTHAFLVALLAVILVAATFFVVEPRVSQAVDSDPFTIKQTILDEISFLVQPNNVTMTGDINGITGGTANGSSTAVVRTNSATGYEMTIAFADNGSGQAMLGDESSSDAIRDYPAVGGEPTYLFSTASTASVFAYTVSADDTSDLDPSFFDDDAACNTGAGFTVDRCWMEPTVAPFQIIERGSAADLGATTTISFRVHVPNNPDPALVADIYTATATLTALNQ